MKSVIVDSRMSDRCKRRLEALGFAPLELSPCHALPTAICAHPDTLICRVGNELFTTADYCDVAPFVFSDLRERHPDLKINFTADTLGSVYPRDCILNALVLGNDFYIKRDTASSTLIESVLQMGYRVIATRQGYPACTTLAAVGERHTFAVTADEGMARLLGEQGVRVSVIRNGGVSLAPYEYGFIGGASGVYKDKIYFAGDITLHPDSEIIINAARDAGFECVSLSDEVLCDVGGMIFID
ncbi:MAG: hypothetical protein IJW03_02820 [Clostridia bacterium]|nr:hypothetical protein [Clostridia bacterium]